MQRIAAQMPAEEKAARANFAILYGRHEGGDKSSGGRRADGAACITWLTADARTRETTADPPPTENGGWGRRKSRREVDFDVVWIVDDAGARVPWKDHFHSSLTTQTASGRSSISLRIAVAAEMFGDHLALLFPDFLGKETTEDEGRNHAKHRCKREAV